MHPAAADILVAANWTGEANQHGCQGTSIQKDDEPAGHGTSSPYDVHNTLIAAGMDIKSGVVSDVPSGNVDFAPTLCCLNGIQPPDSMNGRVLKELLRGGPSPATVKVQNRVYRTQVRGSEGGYQLELSCSIVSGTEYLNFTRVKRQAAQSRPDARRNWPA